MLGEPAFLPLSSLSLSQSINAQDGTEKYSCQYISLYKYTPLDKNNLPKLRSEIHKQWQTLNITGRVYIAEEGINGQILVPEPAINAFKCSFPRLLKNANLFHGQVKDTSQIELGKSISAMPFNKLHIRIRDQILYDGFQRGGFNLQESGNSLLPEQWHQRLKRRNEANDSDTLVLDVRNFYEHEIGRFDGATRIMVDTYKSTFDAVDEIIEKHEKEHDGQKPKEVMMYCTGGIRCEKVGAYLTQYKGISNIQKLHGGIINYMQFLNEQRHAHHQSDHGVQKFSLFKGKNFVFDQRCVDRFSESEKVTDDILGKCFQCGEPCNHHTNCSNVMCHGLVLQCSKCAVAMLGACGESCKHEVLKMRSMTIEEQRSYRKVNALKWKPKNPNSASVKFIKIRPASPELLQKSEMLDVRSLGPAKK
ncbi:hypothetical protein CCR75_007160 [Bremia lactucae]|uniref:Rhodanese domain-containing protein n=1 Tax=Bremia lactucae TaxID=4779 RepID=A0A976IAX6_BRELC|nr:hypothetical protein CCR75_007160 [Bremia lactucae]